MLNRIIEYIMPESSPEEEKQPLLANGQRLSQGSYALFSHQHVPSALPKQQKVDCHNCPKCRQRREMEKLGFDKKAIGLALRQMKPR